MRKGIGKRLVNSFLLIIIITVSIISVSLIIGFKEFYYNTIENELENRLIVSMDSYNKFYSDKSIEELLIDDTDLLWGHINAEVQILDKNGFILMDSIGAIPDDAVDTSDLVNARSSGISSWVGYNKYADEMIMAVTGALKNNNGDIIGYLRFISSMEEANAAILRTSLTIGLLSLLVVAITTFVSVLLANSIVRPIKELTTVANKMADGQYKVRSTVDTEDEIGQLSRALNSMAEEILKKEQIKNDFISSISHELRTPLTSIKGWAVVLKSAKEDEQELINDGLTIIENESDRLAKMVEELLDFSRYISGRIQLEKDTFNISDTCNDVSKQMKPRAESNDVKFITEIEDEKALVIGDDNRIRQLLINLLDNAIKFTSKDGWVKFKASTDEGKYVILISDNGMGISKEELSHVKEKFYKGKHSNSHSGIGLSISDEIAKLHGGSLEIFSEEKIGTTVKVTIPMSSEVENNEE